MYCNYMVLGLATHALQLLKQTKRTNILKKQYNLTNPLPNSLNTEHCSYYSQMQTAATPAAPSYCCYAVIEHLLHRGGV